MKVHMKKLLRPINKQDLSLAIEVYEAELEDLEQGGHLANLILNDARLALDGYQTGRPNLERLIQRAYCELVSETIILQLAYRLKTKTEALRITGSRLKISPEEVSKYSRLWNDGKI
jgi:hypothetical protein